MVDLWISLWHVEFYVFFSLGLALRHLLLLTAIFTVLSDAGNQNGKQEE